MTIKTKFVCILILFMFVTIGCGKKESTNNDELTIGILVPLNGTQAKSGNEVLQLLEIIEETINKPSNLNLPFHEGSGLPNLNGKKIRFAIGDSSTPEIAMIEAERLITEENATALTGLLSSASTKTIMVPAERYGVFLLSEGTSESLTQEGYDFFGRTYPGDSVFVKETFDYLEALSNEQEKKIKKIALVSEDSEFGTNIAKIEKQLLKKYDFELVEEISYSAMASNVTSEVLRLKKAKPDAIIMSSYISDALLFMSTFKEQNYFPPVLFGQRGGFASSDFISNLGSDSNYVFSTARWNTDFKSKATEDLVTAFYEKSKGTELIGDVMAVGWNAYLIAIAANQSGKTDSKSIKEEMNIGLKVIESEDPTGMKGYQYGKDGQNKFASAIIVQIQNAEMVTVYPKSLATKKEIYPSPSW